LEAMQELQVTVGRERYPLAAPFFVLATQNPIEQEGTYPLPEAQLDRFMFMINIDYPTESEEMDIIKLTTVKDAFQIKVESVLSGEEVLYLQEVVRRVPVSEHLIAYATKLVRLSRVHLGNVPSFIKDWVQWGASPRAIQYLIIGAKARAVLQGRYYVAAEDIKALAHPVMRHRIITNFSAEAEGITTDKIIDKLLEEVSPMETELEKEKGIPKVLKI